MNNDIMNLKPLKQKITYKYKIMPYRVKKLT